MSHDLCDTVKILIEHEKWSDRKRNRINKDISKFFFRFLEAFKTTRRSFTVEASLEEFYL